MTDQKDQSVPTEDTAGVLAERASQEEFSIRKAILERNPEEIDPENFDTEEYNNVILDALKIKQISSEDKAFLEKFTECLFLSFNSTNMTSLVNFPKIEKLERLELNDNLIEGGLEHLVAAFPNLKTLKLSNNRIRDFSEIEKLKELKALESLDISSNPLSIKPVSPVPSDQIDSGSEKKESISQYQKKVRGILAQLKILDSLDSEGNEVESDEDEEEPASGEDDYEEDEEDDGIVDEYNDEDDDEEEEVSETKDSGIERDDAELEPLKGFNSPIIEEEENMTMD